VWVENRVVVWIPGEFARRAEYVGRMKQEGDVKAGSWVEESEATGSEKRNKD
jgi:hypothetical protein